jgi:hypothetical protein
VLHGFLIAVGLPQGLKATQVYPKEFGVKIATLFKKHNVKKTITKDKTNTPPRLIVVQDPQATAAWEFCNLGSLKSFLRRTYVDSPWAKL